MVGFNDLQSQFPEIAAEAYGWDPSLVSKGSSDGRRQWKCSRGHIYDGLVKDRTGDLKCGCPFCSGQRLMTGFNDLRTRFPEVAEQAYGWDPCSITPGSKEKKQWKCSLGHTWIASPNNRTTHESGCAVCTNKQVLSGFNDLRTLFPEIAEEAYGWDPSSVVFGTHTRRQWVCSKGHKWFATVVKRTTGRGCPNCAAGGFSPEKPAWFYLMQRAGEQQLGITNSLENRLQQHESNGWILLEHTTKSAPGQKVLDTEKAFKKWLRKEIGLMEGTTENWSTSKMEVQSLAELKARSGIETDLF